MRYDEYNYLSTYLYFHFFIGLFSLQRNVQCPISYVRNLGEMIDLMIYDDKSNSIFVNDRKTNRYFMKVFGI